MTDEAKELVERLRGDWPEILVEKHWMMDSDAIDKQREEAADLIETQAREIERLTLTVRKLQGNQAALEAELAKFKTLAETLAGALGDIFERFDAKTPNHRGNAPGHGHETPGIWDADNGEKAGQPCVWCKDWNSAREALRQYKEARDAS